MNNDLASESIEYVGNFGITQTCIDGLMRYLQFDAPIKEAKVITCGQQHGFIIFTEERLSTIVIRGGFSSGYPGEGSGGFAYALSILEDFNVDTDEFEVNGRFFTRLNRGQLTYKDLEALDAIRPVRPTRIYDYIYAHSRDRSRVERHMPIPMPLRLIDTSIRDLAIDFWTDPGERILTAFRRLEDAIRKECHSEEHGAKLFTQAFLGNNSVLTWDGLTNSEQAARANLFKDVYGSFRNPRAHRVLDNNPEDLLSEFLTLNQLFRLESEAVIRETQTEEAK